MIFSIACSIITFEISKLKHIGAIRASSLMGIIIYLLSLRFISLETTVLFGATFVGMCSSHRINRFELILSTLCYLLALSFLKKYFTGIGGILGMSSFIGVLTIFTLSFLHKKIRKK